MSSHIVRKVCFRSVRNLRILRSSVLKWLCYAALNSYFAQVFMLSVKRAQFAHLWQNHVLNVAFAVSDCPTSYCSKFPEQSVPLHLPNVVQVIWADIQFPYRLENCFLFLSDYESMLLRHLQDVCENLGVLNREFPCWCHTKSVISWQFSRCGKGRNYSTRAVRLGLVGGGCFVC